MFLINSYVYQSFSGLDLADYSSDSPVLALSTRRINSGYTGALIRLRRSTDNTEQDFGSGLGMGETLDYSAIDTFLSGGTAHVVKWYDQSGQGRDLQQQTASRQPTFDAGATTGRAVKFSGLSDCHLSSVSQVSGGFFSSGPAVSIHHATDNNDNGFCSNMSLSTAPHSNGNITYFRTNRYSNVNRFVWRGVQFAPTGSTSTSGNEYNYYHHDGSNLRVDLNGSEIGSIGNTTTANSGADSFNLGADATAHEWDGYTYELIIFDSSQSTANSDAIRDDMNSQYSLYT
jgi:hypothetical protein